MSALASAFRVMLEVSWRMACVITALMALRHLIRGWSSPRVLYWAWVAVALLLLLPYSIPVRWSPYGIVGPRGFGAGSGIDPSHEQGSRDAPRSRNPSSGHEASSDRTQEHLPSIEILACLWAGGVLLLVAGRLVAHQRFRLRLRREERADDNASTQAIAAIAGGFGAPRFRIALTEAVASPALYGVFSPCLLIPRGLMRTLSHEELRLVVCHELCHHRRRDLATQLLVHAAQTVHWFNPLVWVASRASRDDCELACDEDVVRTYGSADPGAYGAILLKIACQKWISPLAPLGVGIVETKRQIKTRIRMLMTPKPSSFVRTGLGWSVFALVAVFGITRESQGQQPANTVPIAAAAATTSAAPAGWWKNGSQPADYVVGTDPSQEHLGQASAYVKSIVPQIKGFGGMMQMCRAEKFVGRRLRLSAWMKTKDANDGGAHLWFRVDSKERDEILQFDNMDGRAVMGTTDWGLYSVVLDVPSNSAALAYGFFVSGTGQAWVSGFNIEEVGTDVPSTDIHDKHRAALPESPVNLGFVK